MADTQLKDLTAATSVISTDLLYTVVDPAGTPLDRKLTVGNLASSLNSLVDHGGLAGLSDDDHAQYAVLAGRAGGQTLIGGTGASDTLVLASDASAYDASTFLAIVDGGLFGYLGGTLQYSLGAAAAFNRSLDVGTDPLGALPGQAGVVTLWTDDDGSNEPAAVRDRVKCYAWDQAAGDTRLKIKSETGNAVILGNGTVQTDRLVATIASGTAPLTVSSTTAVANLNADLVDGQHAASFAAVSHTHAASDITAGLLATSRGGTGLDTSSVAKGGLLAVSSTGVWSTLAVGSDQKLLTADSSATPGLKWADVPLPPAYRYGFTWYRSATDPTNDISIYGGGCRSSDNTFNIVVTDEPRTKQLDAAWAAGNNAGGLDTGARANNTWYWIWAIARSDTGDTDYLFSTSNTTPTMPASYDKKRLIGCFRTGASLIAAFDTRWVGGGIYVRWIDPATNGLDVNVTNLGSTRTTYTLSYVPAFGDTIYASVYFDAHVLIDHASLLSVAYIANPDHVDSAPSATFAPLSTISMVSNTQEVPTQVQLYANRSAQITARSNNMNTTLKVQVLGFFWPGGI